MTPVETWEAFRDALAEELASTPQLTSRVFNSARWPEGQRWDLFRNVVTAALSRISDDVIAEEFTVRGYSKQEPLVALAVTDAWDRVTQHHATLADGPEQLKAVMTVMYWGQSRGAYRDALLSTIARHPGNARRSVVATIVGEQRTDHDNVSFYAHAVSPDGRLLICNPDVQPPDSERFYRRSW